MTRNWWGRCTSLYGGANQCSSVSSNPENEGAVKLAWLSPLACSLLPRCEGSYSLNSRSREIGWGWDTSETGTFNGSSFQIREVPCPDCDSLTLILNKSSKLLSYQINDLRENTSIFRSASIKWLDLFPGILESEPLAPKYHTSVIRFWRHSEILLEHRFLQDESYERTSKMYGLPWKLP